MSDYIAVVGGINVDITGTSDARLVLSDSNPGRVRVTLGGVGRNIAENLVRLSQKVLMITAMGDDAHADIIRRSCGEMGLDLSHSKTFPGRTSNTYLCINDAGGDVLTAVSDMGLCDEITPAFLEERLDVLNHASLVILDANLPAASLAFLAGACTAPMMADPVSTKKAPRLSGCLWRLMALKPNGPEAECLSGCMIHGTQGLEEAALALMQEGVENVFITLGNQGVYYMSQKEAGFEPCLPGPVINTNGCGDAFFAAAALALIHHLPASKAAVLGQAAAAICARADSAVNPDLTLRLLEQQAGITINGGSLYHEQHFE